MANSTRPLAAVSIWVIPRAGSDNNFIEVATKFNASALQTNAAKTVTMAITLSVPQILLTLLLRGSRDNRCVDL
jgi:hypothetical protein